MGNILCWFLWRRWFFLSWMIEYNSKGYTPKDRFKTLLPSLHNNNVAGCRNHPCIYRDMCRICGI